MRDGALESIFSPPISPEVKGHLISQTVPVAVRLRISMVFGPAAFTATETLSPPHVITERGVNQLPLFTIINEPGRRHLRENPLGAPSLTTEKSGAKSSFSSTVNSLSAFPGDEVFPLITYSE